MATKVEMQARIEELEADSRPTKRRQPRRRLGEPAGLPPAANRPLPHRMKGYSALACSSG